MFACVPPRLHRQTVVGNSGGLEDVGSGHRFPGHSQGLAPHLPVHHSTSHPIQDPQPRVWLLSSWTRYGTGFPFPPASQPPVGPTCPASSRVHERVKSRGTCGGWPSRCAPLLRARPPWHAPVRLETPVLCPPSMPKSSPRT